MSETYQAPRQLKVWEAYILPIVVIVLHLVLLQSIQALYLRLVENASENQAYIAGPLILNILLIPIYAFYLKNRKKRASETLRQEPLTRGNLFLTLAWGVIGTLLTAVISALLLSALKKMPGAREILENFNLLNDVLTGEGAPLWQGLLSISLFGPIAEELLMRGIVLGAFKDRLKPHLAVFLSAVIFGIMHLNLIQGVYATALGLLLGYLYLYTKNLLYPILMHIVVNFLGSGLSQIFDIQQNPTRIMIHNIFVILLGFCAAGYLIWWHVKETSVPRKRS